jgi:hypothetical protein
VGATLTNRNVVYIEMFGKANSEILLLISKPLQYRPLSKILDKNEDHNTTV